MPVIFQDNNGNFERKDSRVLQRSNSIDPARCASQDNDLDTVDFRFGH